MVDVPARYLEVLKGVCDLPTAPFCEGFVVGWLEGWANGVGLESWRDGAGNFYVEYLKGERSETPLVVEAHMDHPGFLVVGSEGGGVVKCEFRGGVKVSYFVGEGVRFFIENQESRIKKGDVNRGRWVKGRVLDVVQREGGRVMDVRVQCEGEIPPIGSLGMWDLPGAEVDGEFFLARVCDDLVGCCGIVCMMEELLKSGVEGHVIGMFDRGEEVGFAGVIAACENGWVAKGARVIGLETSKGGFGVGAVAPQGNGPVVRVGDRTGIFSAGLTHFIMQAAGFIGDEEAGFKVQRKLMDGGMCNTTAFVAYGFDAAGMTLPIGGYHNMAEAEEVAGSEKGGGKIVREWIHLGDFCGMVRVLVEVVKRYPKYKAGFGEMRERLEKMHREEQGMLWERKG